MLSSAPPTSVIPWALRREAYPDRYLALRMLGEEKEAGGEVTIPKLNAATRAQWHLPHLRLPRFLVAWAPYPGLTSLVDVGGCPARDCPVSQGACSLPCVQNERNFKEPPAPRRQQSRGPGSHLRSPAQAFPGLSSWNLCARALQGSFQKQAANTWQREHCTGCCTASVLRAFGRGLREMPQSLVRADEFGFTSYKNKSREEERGLQKKEHYLCLLFPLGRSRQNQILSCTLCTLSFNLGKGRKKKEKKGVS
ncbi:hypothetical protein MC885_016470 [Smutsia gigantea]|nr:hypothetical protein MC885_016470 [Smutsia gigantea]